MNTDTEWVIIARSDLTGAERIAAEYRHKHRPIADSECRRMQIAANACGAEVTYRVVHWREVGRVR